MDPRIIIDTAIVTDDSLEVVGSVSGIPRALGRSADGNSATTIVDYRLIGTRGDTLGHGLLRGGGVEGTMNPLHDQLPLPIDFIDSGRLELYLAPLGDSALASADVDAKRIRRGAMTSIRIFFANIHMAKQGECAAVFPVSRRMRRSADYVEGAIGALLKGPTGDEIGKGYRTSIPGGVRLHRGTLDSGIARLVFNGEIDRLIDSCSAETLRAQIQTTLRQFASVREVVW